jgi:hypothetical protein
MVTKVSSALKIYTVEAQWKNSGSTVEAQWKHSGSTVEAQWKHSGSTVDVHTLHWQKNAKFTMFNF